MLQLVRIQKIVVYEISYFTTFTGVLIFNSWKMIEQRQGKAT